MKKDIFENLKIPVISAPMFLVSGIDLVVEACKSGIVGTFPALNARSTELLDEWLTEIDTKLEGKYTYGVNLIVHQTNPRLEEDLKICIKHKVPLIITSLGAVSDLVDKVHAYGGQVFHDVTNLRHAKKADGAGVDGLIAVGAGAGGHAGTLSPFALVAELKTFFKGKIALAGAISNGGDVLAARAMGADFAYMGTRFINTKESMAAENYKKMIVDSRASEVVYTPVISGIPANFMEKSLLDNGFKLEELKEGRPFLGYFHPSLKMKIGKIILPLLKNKKKNISGSLMEKEAKAWKNVWSAGQGVAGISDVLPIAELVERLKDEYEKGIEGIRL